MNLLNEEDDLKPVKVKSRAELVALLKEIAKDEAVYIRPYVELPRLSNEIRKGKCHQCKKDIRIWKHTFSEDERIVRYVRMMRKLGYDAKVEFLCGECLRKRGIADERKHIPITDEKEKRDWVSYGLEESDTKFDMVYEDYYLTHLFSFRTSPDEDYHTVISDDATDYSAVLSLLRYERPPSDKGWLKHKIKALQRMTGLSFEGNGIR